MDKFLLSPALTALQELCPISSPCTSTGSVVPFLQKRKGKNMTNARIDLPQGTLDLLILRTLALGPQHGWAISERVQQMSSDVLQIQQGSLYPALHRMERRGLIKARWGTSENNRRAKYYELSKNGRQQLEVQKDAWQKLTAAVAQVLGTV
jgi:PadR family transcriptional regulator, regulatory protein PadR